MLIFHLVNVSSWPIFCSIGALCLTLGSVFWWKFYLNNILYLGILMILSCSMFWWSDVMKEKMSGYHNSIVKSGLCMGMIYFILSEVFFFFSFFWSFFHNCWGSQGEIGYIWPPYQFNKLIIDSFSIPLLNTVILLSSGISMTWAHYSLLKKDFFFSSMSLFITLFLGLYFLFLQMNEYAMSYFSMKFNVYGTCFFMLTGFHGAHVTIGSIMLFICFLRQLTLHFSNMLHVGFEAAAWYWHFVDVVWLFLYFFVYWL